MKRVERLKNKQLYVDMANIIRIGNQALKIAKEENKAFGIPDTFWRNGRIYYVLVSGEITLTPPEIML